MDFESIAGLLISVLFVAYGGFSLLVLDDPEAAHQTLQAIIAGEPVREFEYEMREDSGWEKVGFMYNYE